MNTILDQHLFRLHEMLDLALTYQRGHGSRGEQAFFRCLCTDFYNSRLYRHPSRVDDVGNLHVDLRSSPQHRTLFTAHTDTVCDPKSEELYNPVVWAADDPRKRPPHVTPVGVSVPQARYAQTRRALIDHPALVLGADDGAGVALLCHMIHHKVPGYYIFFRGEERGGIGSQWLAANEPTLLQQFDRAVAFDRKGQHDVITHQGWGRCCSDEFATALAEALSTEDASVFYMPDDTGVFTDTANLVDLIPECTNVSVGYENEHTPEELLDIDHLRRLALRVLVVPWDDLPVKRDPAATDDVFVMRCGTPSAAGWEIVLDDEAGALMDALYDAYDDEDTQPLRAILADACGPGVHDIPDRLLLELPLIELADWLADGEPAPLVMETILEALTIH